LECPGPLLQEVAMPRTPQWVTVMIVLARV
jgi:hypothetical protein